LSKIKNLLSISGADYFGAGISGIFWFTLATLISPEEFGEIHYYLAIAGLAYGISLIGSSDAILVYVAKKIQLQSTLSLLSLVIGTISAIVIILHFTRIDVSFLLLVFIINDLAIGYLLGKKLFVSYSKYILTQKSLTLALGISFYFIFGPDGIIYALALSYVHFLIIIYKIFRSSKIDFSALKSHAGFVSNNYLMKLLTVVETQVDKIIIVPLIGLEILGNYALALQIVFILMIFPGIIYKYTLPQDATGVETKRIKIVALVGSVGLSILGITLVPIILPEIFPKYSEAVTAIQIISIAIVPAAIVYFYTSKLLGMEKSKTLVISRGLKAITVIVGILLLAPTFKIIGLSVAFVLSAIIETVFLVLSYHLWIKRST
jgi:O-antigen/teichoic acid export membrane protein